MSCDRLHKTCHSVHGAAGNPVCDLKIGDCWPSMNSKFGSRSCKKALRWSINRYANPKHKDTQWARDLLAMIESPVLKVGFNVKLKQDVYLNPIMTLLKGAQGKIAKDDFAAHSSGTSLVAFNFGCLQIKCPIPLNLLEKI